jgi:mRNA interferase MazF
LKRGDIWTVASGPHYSGKPRPVLILQGDSFPATDSVTVCLLTSHALDSPLFRVPIESNSDTGLHEPSWAMVDKITTVPRAKMGELIGALAATDMAPINRAILVFLGLAGQARG